EGLDVHVRGRPGEPGRKRERDRELRLDDRDPKTLSRGILALLACSALLPGSTAAASRETHLVYTRDLGATRSAVWIADGEGRHPRRLAAGNYGLVAPRGNLVAIDRGENDV